MAPERPVQYRNCSRSLPHRSAGPVAEPCSHKGGRVVPLFRATSTIWGECDDGPFSPVVASGPTPSAGLSCCAGVPRCGRGSNPQPAARRRRQQALPSTTSLVEIAPVAAGMGGGDLRSAGRDLRGGRNKR